MPLCRGLHSFTFQLNLSDVCHRKPSYTPYTPYTPPETPLTRATRPLRAPPAVQASRCLGRKGGYGGDDHGSGSRGTLGR